MRKSFPDVLRQTWCSNWYRNFSWPFDLIIGCTCSLWLLNISLFLSSYVVCFWGKEQLGSWVPSKCTCTPTIIPIDFIIVLFKRGNSCCELFFLLQVCSWVAFVAVDGSVLFAILRWNFNIFVFIMQLVWNLNYLVVDFIVCLCMFETWTEINLKSYFLCSVSYKVNYINILTVHYWTVHCCYELLSFGNGLIELGITYLLLQCQL